MTATNLDGSVKYVNEAEARMFGVSKDQLIGRTIFDFGEDSSKGATQQEILDTTLQQGAWRGEVVNYDADGNEYILDCRTLTIKDRHGEAQALCSVSTDITTRKKAEEKIREQHEEIRKEKRFLQQIAETSPAGITKVDKMGSIVYANDAAEKVLRLRKSQIQNRTYDDVRWGIVNADGTPYPADKLPFVLVQTTGNPVYGIEHAIQFPDGTRTLLSINAAPLYDHHGNFDGMVSAIEDITERKQAEEKLREANDTKDRFFSIIAHDLKNPFFVFQNGTELLKEHLQNSNDAFAQELSVELHTRAQQLSEFLDNLLTWARLQRGSMPYIPQKVDIYALSQTYRESFTRECCSKEYFFNLFD